MRLGMMVAFRFLHRSEILDAIFLLVNVVKTSVYLHRIEVQYMIQNCHYVDHYSGLLVVTA